MIKDDVCFLSILTNYLVDTLFHNLVNIVKTLLIPKNHRDEIEKVALKQMFTTLKLYCSVFTAHIKVHMKKMNT